MRKLPHKRLSGLSLARVHRAGRDLWWFGSSESAPGHGGRFALPPPNGSCYLATTAATAVLEALHGDFSGGMLPASALRARVLSTVVVPGGSPPAANLMSTKAAGAGVTAGIWADGDRARTQQWASELHGAGWQALYHGALHEPAARGRSVTLFDRSGAHDPWGAPWPAARPTPLLDPTTVHVLTTYGITVTSITRPYLELRDSPD